MTKEIKVDDHGVVSDAPKGDREKRWDAYVKNYAVQNPVKFAQKNAPQDTFDALGKKVGTKPGEFDKIPDSFK